MRRKRSEGRSVRPQTVNRVQGRERIIVEINAYGPFIGAGSNPQPPPPSANIDIPSTYIQKQKD
jgi:hypothetical protein